MAYRCWNCRDCGDRLTWTDSTSFANYSFAASSWPARLGERGIRRVYPIWSMTGSPLFDIAPVNRLAPAVIHFDDQRSGLVHIQRDASDGASYLLDRHPLTQRRQPSAPCLPKLALRLLPAHLERRVEAVQSLHEFDEEWLPRDGVAERVGESSGARRQFGVARQRAIDVEANAQHGVLLARLDQNPTDLAPSDEHVVGPFDLGPQPGGRLDSLSHGERARHHQKMRRERRMEDDRERQLLVWQRLPDTAQT